MRREVEAASGIALPDATQEASDPQGSDGIYETAVVRMRNMTRDKCKFRLVFQELRNFGYERVNQETRWYLIETLLNARSRVAADSFTRRHLLSHFAGVLAGFRYQGLITQAEEEAWNRKMTLALGWTLPDPPPAGIAQFVRLEGDDLPVVPELDLTKPAVLRRLSASQDVVSDYHGSSFRISGVDICDSRTVVEWRVSPEPDVPSLFPEDFAALEAELENVDGWAANELRKKAWDAFIREKVYVFELADDIGTQYQRTRHMGHYGSEAATGEI